MRRNNYQGRIFISELSRKGDLIIDVNSMFPCLILKVKEDIVKARMNTKVLYIKFIDKYYGDTYKNIIIKDNVL